MSTLWPIMIMPGCVALMSIGVVIYVVYQNSKKD